MGDNTQLQQVAQYIQSTFSKNGSVIDLENYLKTLTKPEKEKLSEQILEVVKVFSCDAKILEQEITNLANKIDFDIQLKEGESFQDWNESLTDIFLKIRSLSKSYYSITPSFSSYNLFNMDAGWSFKNSPWVKPNKNLDGHSYDFIRGKDAVKKILNTTTAAQFTRKQEKTTKVIKVGSLVAFIFLYLYTNVIVTGHSIKKSIEDYYRDKEDFYETLPYEIKEQINVTIDNDIDFFLEIWGKLKELTTQDQIEKDIDKYMKQYSFIDLAQAIFNIERKNSYESFYNIVQDQEDQEFFLALLQQTIEIDEKAWVRLIMPKNSRKVYVEDLNRNFWILSVALSALLESLFNGKYPLKNILRDMLKEIVRLWDNVLSLWGAIYVYLHRSYFPLRIVTLPMPTSTIYHEIKYDNFDFITKTELEGEINKANEGDQDGIDSIFARLSFLWERFDSTNLIIIPYLRRNNYKNNYYSIETYPCLITYNAKTQTPKYIQLDDGEYGMLNINPAEFREQLFAASETENYYQYTYSLASVSNTYDKDEKNFYGALRVKILLEASIDTEISISSLKFIGYDAIQEALFGPTEKLKQSLMSGINNDSVLLQYNSTSIKNNMIIFQTIKKDIPSDNSVYGAFFDIIPDHGYYLGEIPSYSAQGYTKPEFKPIQLNSLETRSQLIKIGNFLPVGFNSILDREDLFQYQLNPNGEGLTDYALNITPKDAQTYSANGITLNGKGFYYKGYGSALDHLIDYIDNNTLTKDNPTYYAYLYTPYKTGVGLSDKPIYQEVRDLDGFNQQNVAAQTAKLGLDVISSYIAQLYLNNNTKEDADKITYYIGGIGIYPWHNQEKQGYWTQTVLTHVFKYIPARLEKIIAAPAPGEFVKPVAADGIRKGTLTIMGLLSKLEYAFNINGVRAFSNTNPTTGQNTTTWRLPELRPVYGDKYDNYLEIEETHSQERYYLDPKSTSDMENAYEEAVRLGDLEEFCEWLASNYESIKQYLKSSVDLSPEFNIMGGQWCVYDGNVPNPTGNKHIYKHNKNLREVAYTYFTYDNSENLLLPKGEEGITIPGEGQVYAYGRTVNESGLHLIDGNDIFPNYEPLQYKGWDKHTDWFNTDLDNV